MTYQGWSIRAIEPGKGTGYTAQRRDGRGSIQAPDPAALEARLMEAETQR